MIPAPTASPRLGARQLWNLPSAETLTKPCEPVTISEGIFILPSTTFTITEPVIYNNPGASCPQSDAFFASTSVFIYVLATSTVIAWILLILLLTAQRAFYPGRTSPSSGWKPGRTIATGIAGRTQLGGLGSRPWLQKVAAFLVACGLTVASVDAFREAARQHRAGITDAALMRDDVSGSKEVRILRVISGVFAWLAQVQTLIRLFPRRKEKLVIKWIGFALILCDTVFSCLNSFWINAVYARGSPRNYQDAIPALSYLFQLALSLLYAAWVLYYVITKRTYAFFRPAQLNMSIIAILALTSIAIPVGFFVADISVPEAASWGDFLRWVGAVAASVVVWEWVDRIEDVEREEKKDGILGREVFEDEEQPTSENRSGGSSNDSSTNTWFRRGLAEKTSALGIAGLLGKRHDSQGTEPPVLPRRRKRRRDGPEETLGVPERPISVPSRENTASGGSTVYAVHYHPVTDTPPQNVADAEKAVSSSESGSDLKPDAPSAAARLGEAAKPAWNFAAQAFKRRKRSPPVEVKQALSMNALSMNALSHGEHDIEKVAGMAAENKDFRKRFTSLLPRIADSGANQKEETNHTQPTVIPAPPRGHTWSPEILRHSPVNALDTGVATNTLLNVHPLLQQTPVRFGGIEANGDSPDEAPDGRADAEPAPSSRHITSTAHGAVDPGGGTSM